MPKYLLIIFLLLVGLIFDIDIDMSDTKGVKTSKDWNQYTSARKGVFEKVPGDDIERSLPERDHFKKGEHRVAPTNQPGEFELKNPAS